MRFTKSCQDQFSLFCAHVMSELTNIACFHVSFSFAPVVRLYRVTSRTAASHPSYREFLCNMRAIHKYHVIRQKNNFELAALSSSPATSCVLGLRSWYAGLGAVDYHQVSSIWRLVKTCMKYTIWFIVYKFYLKRL